MSSYNVNGGMNNHESTFCTNSWRCREPKPSHCHQLRLIELSDDLCHFTSEWPSRQKTVAIDQQVKKLCHLAEPDWTLLTKLTWCLSFTPADLGQVVKLETPMNYHALDLGQVVKLRCRRTRCSDLFLVVKLRWPRKIRPRLSHCC